MKPNPKKLSFAALAILFAAHVGVCLFAGSVFAGLLQIEAYTLLVGATLFVASHFFKIPDNVLADVTITDTTYAGEFYDIFLMKMILGFDTMRKGLIKVQSGIKKKGNVGTIDIDSFIQAKQDPPKFGGNASVGGRPLVPDDVMGYMETDPSVFNDHWLAVQMNPALLDADLPATFESAAVNRIVQLNGNWMDKIYWRGVKDDAAIATAIASGLTATDNNLIFTDGIIKICKDTLDAANVILTTSTTPAVALTKNNIIGKFDDIKAMILSSPDGAAAYNDPNFKFVVSYLTASLYGDAVKAQQYKGADVTQKASDSYDGKPIVSVGGIYDDTIWAGVATQDERSQLWMGCNEADEETQFRIAKLQANSEKVFIKMLAKFCAQIAIPEQCWLYTTA
jgi:hypothetical protein